MLIVFNQRRQRCFEKSLVNLLLLLNDYLLPNLTLYDQILKHVLQQQPIIDVLKYIHYIL